MTTKNKNEEKSPEKNAGEAVNQTGPLPSEMDLPAPKAEAESDGPGLAKSPPSKRVPRMNGVSLRAVKAHRCGSGLNELINIGVMDEPGAGGASHFYRLEPMGPQPLPVYIGFQQGPVEPTGPNGVSMEALLAVVADRLEGFASGPFPSDENASALKCVTAALYWLHARTKRLAAEPPMPAVEEPS